ncbi:Aldose 1-epimerase [Klebsiella pneumoniae subsp. pneumoniae ST258-K28BO]|nr:Aldose 1-epimerase [Klebsiella pneumoniae subsp. pneumoniae ST258-K28BO]
MLTQTTALAPDGRPWQQVTLRNKSGMTVTVADWGATLLSAEVPLGWPMAACADRCWAAQSWKTMLARPHFLAPR